MNTCRVDGSELIPLWDLGVPCVSDFVKHPQEGNPFPLQLAIGRNSGLVQLQDTYDPELMYRNYYYRSGANPAMRRALQDVVTSARRYVNLNIRDVVVDIGANDQYLLYCWGSGWGSEFRRVGFEPAGNIDPCLPLSSEVIINDFFKASLYPEKKKAKVITSVAMFYDLSDPKQFVRDIDAVLDEEGVWICQMSYLPLMLSNYAWDGICHEHLTYYTAETFAQVINQSGTDLYVVDAELNDVNGGSVRFYVMKGAGQDRLPRHVFDLGNTRQTMLDLWEDNTRPTDLRVWDNFRVDCLAEGRRLVVFLERCLEEKKRVIGYGASTKANTLLQVLGITPELLPCIAERSEEKVGRYCGGSGIPIISEEEMREMKPDYLLALPWHFIGEFLRREKDLLEAGTRFVVPLPEFKVVE